MLAVTPNPITNLSESPTSAEDSTAVTAGGLSSFTSSTQLASSLDSYEDDIAGWLNDLLDSSDQTSIDATLTALDKDVQQLATRLDVASQDTASQLEQSIDDISRTIPRLTYDLQFMRESALSLQDALQTIIPASNDSSNTTTAVLDRLHYLDTVKHSLEKTYSVLREAESWSTLDSEITTLLSSQSYAPAASRLSEASRSLALFSNTPEYESRRALMISLQNQLEAALSSALVAAITKRDVQSCKGYYEIFSDIQREVEFRNYYFGSRRKELVEMWSSAKLLEAGDDTTDENQQLQKFTALLKEFFAGFHTLLVEERSYTVSIFPDPQQTLSSFVQSTIDSLNPSFAQRLSAVSEHYGAQALPHLIAAFKVTEEFATGTSKILESAAYSAITTIVTGEDKTTSAHAPGGKSLSRRVSKRMSLSRRMGPSSRSASISGPQGLGNPIGGVGAWEPALFEPFIDFQSEYAALEKKYLDDQVKGVLGAAKGGGGDGARILRERSAAVFDMADDVLERCMGFTHGYGALGLIQAFESTFAGLLETVQAQILSSSKYATTATAATNPGSTDEDYTSEDWDAFQQSLHILETCRAMRDRLGIVDGKIKGSLLQFAGIVQLGRIDPSGLFISGTTKGEMELLTQSTLNSNELHTFLEGLIRESQHSVVLGNTPSGSGSGPNFLSAMGQGDFATPGGSPGQPLLKTAYSAITSFTKATQIFLQNIILLPLHTQLSNYATLSWTSQQRPKHRGTGGGAAAAYDMSIPTFSLSPTPTIQRVAEGLLNLPRMFELHADDDALAFSIETLPFVDERALAAAVSDSDEARPDVSPSPVSSRRRLSSASSAGGSRPRIAMPPPPVLVLTPEMVSSTWLSSLTLSLLSHLTSTVLPSIRTLSQDGAAQLASDLGYLSNIVRAMNVEWDELEKWKELAELSDEEGVKRVKELQAAGDDMELPLRLVSRMRGWRSE